MTANHTAFAIINGSLLPAEQAGFPAHHQSLVDALGIYESIMVEQGRFFELQWHLNRLEESATILGMKLPASLEEIADWARRLMSTTQNGTGLLRVVAFGSDGVYPPVCGLYVKPMPHWAPEAYQSGTWVTTLEGERTRPLAKSTNCLAQALSRSHARKVGAHEGLIVDRNGHVTEGSASNILVVRDGSLLRPLQGTALEGVTENITVKLAQEASIPVLRVPLPLAQASTWQEAMLTSTTRRIIPIRQIDDVALPAAPGPLTRQLMEAFAQYENTQGWDT